MYPTKRPKPRIWIGLVIAGVVLIVAVATLMLGFNRFDLSLQLAGEKAITLDYGTEYVEPGAEANLHGSRFWTDGVPWGTSVKIEGEVDTNTIGTYTVNYSAAFLWLRVSDSRTVEIVDRIPPEIRLVADPEYLTPWGEPYAEEGYTAVDAYDGDLTDKVDRYEENGVVYYSVTDSSGNRTEAIREIAYLDSTAPAIELAGGAEFHMGLGRPYSEPGFTALDDKDGDVTAKVQAEGTVDHRTIGTYTMTYTVTDESGNVSVVTRNVIVEPATPPEEIAPEGKVIYLTFDDGPCYYTDQLLAVLEKYGVKATFFVVGNDPERMKKIVDGGHAIGMHTMTHDYRKIYASEEAFFEELYQLQDLIYENTGTWTTLIRFPGGSSNTVSSFNEGIMSRLTRMVEEHGFQYYDWNVDSDDAGKAKTSQEVYENVINGVRWTQYSVVLQHDIKDYSVAAVEKIIQWGLNHGYTFLPLEPSSPACHHGVNN